MLIKLVEWLNEIYDGKLPGSGLFSYITFRAGVATILSLLISMVFGGRIIAYLKRLQVGETVRDLGLQGQKQKEGTPTMGGVIIIMAILIPCLLKANLNNIYIFLMVVATVWMGVIGFLDDYIKVFKKDKKGLSGKFKVLGQIGLGVIVALIMIFSDQVVVRMDLEEYEASGIVAEMVGDTLEVKNGKEIEEKGDFKMMLTNVPFVKGNQLDYAKLVPASKDGGMSSWVWLLFVPLVIFVVTAVSNAANLTDGLDGLATGVSGIIGLTLGIFAYVSGNAIAATYLNILHLPGSGELVIFAACFLGACLGFLWYNSYPAQIFMGDTGSLTLGGIIATMAIVLRKELLIPLMCGIFLIENLSVVLQVAYF
ncbi:MAG: phospho-N-acetylmuramoyl-pentapeptide-transferase, partial [Saprospiraceae bacterium]